MLAVPDNIESNDRSDITTIEILIDQSKLNDDFSVSKQIENIDLRILLFLPNVSKIDITTESSHIIYDRSYLYEETNEIFLRKYVDGELKADERYSLFERKKEKAVKEDDILKDIHFSVAVPEDPDNFSVRNIYSFFPLLDTVSPFNCVLHATYALGDHRNTVNFSEANKEIIKEQLLFLIDVAKEYVKNDKQEIAYKLLIPSNFSRSNGGFTPPFNSFELEDYYYDLLSTQKIFQTVNNEHISINDGLKIISRNYPSIFAGENFSSLLKPLPNENVVDFIDVLAERKGISVAYKEKELLTAINSSTDSWSASQQVEIFIWWNTLYTNSLPNLLKTQKDIWLRFKEDCYFLIGDFDDKGLPSWVKIPALRRDYQQELFLSLKKQKKL